jgi:DMSO/TMAO reductase YedYZ molybdopterin-dependent catalytic subunit
MTLDVFGRRSREAKEKYGDRLPPGQRLTERWPVFTHGGAPAIDLEQWTFQVTGLIEDPVSFTWEQFASLPRITVASDIHCVTGWSKFDNEWEGVAFNELMKHVRPKPEAKVVMVHSYGGYTTNVPLADLMADDVLFALKHDGEPLSREHGGPCRLVLPKLYFWKSAKWVRGLVFMDRDRPGFWEMHGYHMRGDPWKEERYS